MNLRIFQETEFVYSFYVSTVNVNNNIHFRWKKSYIHNNKIGGTLMNSLKLTNRFPSVFTNPFISTSRRGLGRSLIWVVSKIVTWHYPFCTVILSQGKGYCVTVIGGILVRLKKLENYISAELRWNICYILSCHLKISGLLS